MFWTDKYDFLLGQWSSTFVLNAIAEKQSTEMRTLWDLPSQVSVDIFWQFGISFPYWWSARISNTPILLIFQASFGSFSCPLSLFIFINRTIVLLGKKQSQQKKSNKVYLLFIIVLIHSITCLLRKATTNGTHLDVEMLKIPSQQQQQ